MVMDQVGLKLGDERRQLPGACQCLMKTEHPHGRDPDHPDAIPILHARLTRPPCRDDHDLMSARGQQ
jgi:hypothetical protein